MPIPAQSIQELLGRHMAACRTLAGLSQQQMATRLRVRQPYVAQLEKGLWVHVDPHKLLEYVKLGLDVSAVLQEWLEHYAEAWAALMAHAWQPDTTRAAEDVYVSQHP